ncbi:MAG TPA: MFS transporter [Rhizomicrobium sp.]
MAEVSLLEPSTRDLASRPDAAPGSAAATFSVAGTRAATPLGQWSWALFQWARDFGGIVIVVFIFAPYFTTTVIGDPVAGQALWGHLNAAAGAVTGLLGPVFGAIADGSGRRKPWLGLCVATMAVTSTLLWWSMPGGAGLGLFWSSLTVVLYTIAYNFSDIFQSSMLPYVAPPDRVGFLSGLGVALAQASTVIGMSLLLYAFMLPGQVTWSFVPAHPLFNIDPALHENSRVAGPITAVWLLIFSLAFFLFTPDGVPTSHWSPKRSALSALAEVWQTVRSLRHYRNIATYLLARMFFNDGLVAIMIFSSIYAAGTFRWSALTLTVFGILLSVVSSGGALFGGWLCDRIGAKRAIVAGVATAALFLLLAISISPHALFFVFAVTGTPVTDLPFFRTVPELVYAALAIAASTAVIATFGSSRTLMARLVPPQKASQFFGLYALSGSMTAFLGPELVAATTSVFDSQRLGMASLLVLLCIGLAGMSFVREEARAR